MHGLRIRLSTQADSLPDSEDYVGVKSATVIPGQILPLARSLRCIIQSLPRPAIHKLVHSHILGPKTPRLYTASKKSEARYAGPRENVGPHLLELPAALYRTNFPPVKPSLKFCPIEISTRIQRFGMEDISSRWKQNLAPAAVQERDAGLCPHPID